MTNPSETTDTVLATGGVTVSAPSVNEELPLENDGLSLRSSHVNEGFESDYKSCKPPPVPPPIYTELPPLLPPSFPPLTNQQIKEACHNYVEDTCCYGSRAVRDMIFTSIISDITLHYKLKSLGEKRQTQTQFLPFYGQEIDGPENGPSPAPWDINIERPTDFIEGKYYLEIPHSALVQLCFECSGTGKVICVACGGMKWTSCGCAFGRNGDGSTCYLCGGTGRRTCFLCDYSGRIRCNNCVGNGKLKYYEELIITWQIHEDDFVSNNMNLPAKCIHEATGKELFCEKKAAVSPISHSLDPKINEVSHTFFEKHKNSFLDEFILFQSQTLQAVPITKVTYQWRRKEGEFYVYSLENKVYFEDYPQKCCCCICC